MKGNKFKENVIKLRLEGRTYSEIQKILGIKISKSTLSYWLHQLILPQFARKRLENKISRYIKRAREKAYLTNRRKRKSFLKHLRNKNLYLLKNLSVDTQKLILSTLYLVEGAKNISTRSLYLGNSDPRIIKLYLKLLKNCYKVSSSKFRVRIQCRYDQNPEFLENFWSKTTRIDRKLFYPTYKDSRTKGVKTKKKGYMGVCSLHYFDTSIQLELELLADSVIKFVTAGR